MKFLSIDIETSGLIPDEHDVLEIGVVLADFVTPIEKLPTWNQVILHQKIIGHAYALMMNAKLIAEIAKPDKSRPERYTPDLEEALINLYWWLKDHGMSPEKDEKIHFTAAGKNVAGFDIPFLRQEPTWDRLFQVAHRCFDPGPLYYQHGDKKLPDLATCMQRAGVEGVVTHTAVDDALNVVRVLRAKYGMIDQ